MEWFKKRSKEVTTWSVGIPALIVGLGTLFDADKAQEVGGVVASQGQNLANGDYMTGLLAIGLGIVGLFAREK